LKTLLIDNYDSFTYNLFQLLAEVNGEEPTVVRNDEASWADLRRRGFDNVVLSPGPGRPERSADFGVCAEAVRDGETPLLGVCLGHQGLGWAFGARVVHAPQALHGHVGAILHDGAPLLDGIPREFRAVRYHSLCLAQPLPEDLRPIAWSSDGVVMALEHVRRPLWGVQFHPESVCTEHGRRLLENFRDLSRRYLRCASTGLRGGRRGHPRPNARAAPALECSDGGVPVDPSRRLLVERVDTEVDPEAAFVHLYGERESSFWLDSSRVDERGRFSFMGDEQGPLGATVSYDVDAGELRVRRGAETEVRRESILKYLRRETAMRPQVSAELPFEFECGFVGYFGYELKAECGGDAAHSSPHPDAHFVFADRVIAFDHAEGHTYLLCLVERGEEEAGEGWIAETAGALRSLPPVEASVWDETAAGEGPVEFALERSRERYLGEIEECRRLLADGETYEVCLTNTIEADVRPDPLALYRVLRRVNPAPFSALLRCGELSVLSSSPERMLAVGRDRWAESRPIKGTCRRGVGAAEDVGLAQRLHSDEKNRAENLMIADLLRNDLGSVCEAGTVHVPDLMRVESYETVHQLVSSVRGLLRDGLGPVDAIEACFPAGSMTGAPKRRTMQIIDELEGAARGIYSGAIGYLGLGGACDLSVVIRTIVLNGGSTTIGAGGAIVMQSDPAEEYREMLLKAAAPMQAIDPRVDAERELTAVPRVALEYSPARSHGSGDR
jgi:para-aminobenzoate synthetase